jgi:multiple sugar transport system permease protein
MSQTTTVYSAKPASASPTAWQRIVRAWHRYKWSYFFIAPSMILFAIFIVWPVIQAFLLSFQKVTLRSTEWIGLANFQKLAESQLFWDAMRHTFIYAFFVVLFWISSSLIIAALIQPLSQRLQSLFRGAFYLPYVTSIVVVSLVWLWIFDPSYGVFNYLLNLFGQESVLWLQDPDIALFAIILSTILIVPGTGVVLFSAAMADIPPSLYEAADVEGANAFRKLISITLPMLRPTLLYLMVIYTIAGFQVFERVYIMTAGGPVNSTTTIVQLIFITAFNDFNFGYASAQALILFFIIAVISVVQFRFLGNNDMEY